MNLAALLAEKALLHPQRTALVDRQRGGDRVISYGELARRVAAGAAGLRALGLLPGRVVFVFQPVSIELYVFLLAAFHAGLRVMLADPSAGREFLSHCCRRLPPDAFYGSWKAHCLRLTVAELRRIPVAICSSYFPMTHAWNTDGEGRPWVDVAAEDAALVTFTSGSTGMPKAAVRSHGFLLAQHAALSKSLDFEAGEVDLITLPVFVLANLASGLTSVLAATDLARPGAPDAAAVRAQCEKFHVTRCAASPAFFEGLLVGPLPRFNKVYTGGAPVFPDFLRRLRDALPAAAIHSVYGSTEAEPIAHFLAPDEDEEITAITRDGGGLCAGLAVPEIDLQIIPDQSGAPLTGEQLDFLTDGEVGEIIVSGDHVLRGYLDGLGDAETKIHDGDKVWHRTGDAGRRDSEGRIWLLGRCSERLPAPPAEPGQPAVAWCYPFALECALRVIFPHFRTAAVHWRGERTLVVGKKCGSGEGEAIATKAAELEIYQVIYLESLPLDRRHNAKIDYPALREILDRQPSPTAQGRKAI